jgi:toxin ParE1/3/4
MVKIVWTEISIADLKEIFDYISIDSSRYASIVVNQIYLRAQIISNNPSIGRIVPEFNQKNIREIISRHNYRIIYKLKNTNQVDILRIYHSSRLLKVKLH